ncbi:PX domain-containing protein, partial [Trichonephila clavata]
LLKVESLSLYWNPKCPTNTLVKAQLNSEGWKTLLRKGLATFSINGEDFDFIVKPVSLKTKMILNKSKEAKVPKLLLDFVLQDAASQLSREQVTLPYHLRPSRLSYNELCEIEYRCCILAIADSIHPLVFRNQ